MSELNEKQKAWMLKEEASILQQFPGDPYDSETETEQFLKKIEEIRDLTKDNATVRRWILVIMRYFEDRHKILTGHGNTQAELLKEYAARIDRYKQEERRREEDDGK